MSRGRLAWQKVTGGRWVEAEKLSAGMPATLPGRLELGRDRLKRGREAVALQSCYGVIASTDQFRSRSLRLACPRMLGVRSHGVKVQQNSCPHVLPACASVRHIAITGSLRAGRKNGC